MENFRKKFIEEATEHINELEKALLELEHFPGNKELIEKVFRAMHSLKGGGAMFGFDKISEFTHNLETVYDYVRNGEMDISKELLDTTLESVDHLSNLLNDEESSKEETVKRHLNLSDKIATIINNKKSGVPDQGPKIKDISTPVITQNTEKATTFYIHFQPKDDIFDNGTNPLYPIDELYGLGQCIAIPHLNKIPTYDELIPTKCYVYWEVFLATSQDINAITDVFIFVEDECDIEIHKLADYNLLTLPEFLEKLDLIKDSGKDIGINDLQKFINRLNVSNIKKEKKLEERIQSVSKENMISSIRVSSEKLDNLMNLVSELVTTQARLTLYA
jgi:two-component system chemotaxis sensor kinase CheA